MDFHLIKFLNLENANYSYKTANIYGPGQQLYELFLSHYF